MARSRWGVALALSAAFGALGAATCYRAPTEDDRVACRAAAARIEAAVDRARVADGCVQPFQNSLAVIPFAAAGGLALGLVAGGASGPGRRAADGATT